MTQKQLIEMLVKRVSTRKMRGGSWDNCSKNCRSALRYGYDHAHHDYWVYSFRVALIRRQNDSKTNA